MSESIGPQLGGYRIVRELSSGAQGSVYEAEDPRLGRRVALKTLPAAWREDAEHRARFEREARTLAAINHPNIVTLYGVEEADGVDFIAMEWVDGTTLADRFPAPARRASTDPAASGPEDAQGLAAERLLPLALQLAEALTAAHSRDIVHRDLKPANVMVDGDGRVKVLDFGLAKRRPSELSAEDVLADHPVTRDGQLVGTLLYMAPEQLRGEEVDGRADLFSLGAILFELATGRRAFAGDHWSDVAHAVLHHDPPLVHALHPRLPPALGRIVRRCLEKDPDRRYQRAADLRDDLDHLRRELESGALDTTFDGRTFAGIAGLELSRRARARWTIAAGATIVGLSAVLILLGARGAFAPSDRPPGLDDTFGAAHRADHRPAASPRIAVLPFENLGKDDEAYFTAGVTEEIRTRLGSVSSLRVIAQRSEDDDIEADYRLEGSVRWSPSGDRRVKVTPRLIRESDGQVLWTDSYERVLDDFFAVQSQIGAEVIRQLDVVLLEPERLALASRPTDDMEAYQHYLVGLHLSGRRDPTAKNWQRAVAAFERAVERDPEFAAAWAELSEVHSLVYQLYVDDTAGRLLAARQAVDRALALDPDLPEAHRALGYYEYWGRRDFGEALREFDIALQARPGDSQVLAGLAYVHRRQGRWDEAVARLREALEIDPQSPWLLAEMGRTLRLLRRYSEADLYHLRSIELDPGLPVPYYNRFVNHLMWHGEPAAAGAILEVMPESDSAAYRIALYQRARFDRDTDEALRQLDLARAEVFRQDSQPIPRDFLRGMILRVAGRADPSRAAFVSALATLEGLRRQEPDNAAILSIEGMTRAALGEVEPAIELGRRAVDALPVSRDAMEGPNLLYDLAVIYLWSGRPDDTVDTLERVLAVPSDLSVPFLAADPVLDPLRDHPGFRRLVERASPSGASGSEGADPAAEP